LHASRFFVIRCGSNKLWTAEVFLQALPRVMRRDKSQMSVALSDHISLGEKSPHVDDGLAGEIEVTITRMRRTQDEQIAAPDHIVEG
jgi:hypothetical protein